MLQISPTTYLVHGRHRQGATSALHRLVNSVAFYAIFGWMVIFFLLQFMWVLCCCDSQGRIKGRLMPLAVRVQTILRSAGINCELPSQQPYRRRYRPEEDSDDEELQRRRKERRKKEKAKRKSRRENKKNRKKKKKSDKKRDWDGREEVSSDNNNKSSGG